MSILSLNIAFFNTTTAFKKPADLSFLMKPTQAVAEDMLRVKSKDFKSPPHHMQTLIDGTGVLNWVFLFGDDQVKEWGNETLN